MENEELKEQEEKELEEGKDYTIEELEPRKPSPLARLGPTAASMLLMGMTMYDKMDGFLDTGDYGFLISGGNSNTKDSFGGRHGHKAAGYIEQKGGFKKIQDIGRNDPCICGSGKKYKQCCMCKKQEETK